MLFVECFSPNCPVCQSLEPFFENKEVAKKYNINFANFKLNVENQEVVSFLNERDIWLPSWPMFLFFNGDGKLIHQSDVTPDVGTINDVADIALDPNKRAESYAHRYESGERTLNFLASFAAFNIVTKDTTLAIEVGEKLFEIYPYENLGSRTSWKITKKCILDVNNGFAKYWFNNYSKAKDYEIEDGHAGGENNVFTRIIQNSLIGSRSRFYNIGQLNKIRKYMEIIGAGQYADSYLWELEAKAFIREGNLLKALATGNNIIDKFKENGSARVYITSVFIDNFPNSTFINDARKWLSSSLESISQDNQKAEYYYESARLYKLSGKLDLAKKEAKMAMDFASKNDVLNPKFETLNNSLNI
ncbi:hypothetical protein SAMN06298216_2989 [Spirosomataceae bacterium TFI 002]|nr:hypothetical protein SAMN06298216_2989 [Spirosomataceae bacterium TFI 002]